MPATRRAPVAPAAGSSRGAAAPRRYDAAWLAAAQGVLGYTFTRPALLERALTHASYLNEAPRDARDAENLSVTDNETLELLGDAVLSLVTVERLLAQSPRAAEGELTERRAAFVSETALATAADARGLVSLLRAGKAVALDVPRSARADLVEALVAAVYLDAGPGGLDAARGVVARLLGEPPATVGERPESNKRLLQERLQALFAEAPRYTVTRGDGPGHAPEYVAVVLFHEVSLGTGRGTNKQAATEAAAASAWAEIRALADDAVAARVGLPLRPARAAR